MAAMKGSEFITINFQSKLPGTNSKTITLSDIPIVKKSDNSIFTTYKNNVVTQGHIRSVLTKNRRRFLANSSTPWIPPSNYERAQEEWIFSPAGVYDTPFGSSYEMRGQLYGPSVKSCYSNSSSGPDGKNPYFTGGIGWSVGGSDVNNAKNRARTTAINDLASAKANIGENLATAVKTADLFLDAGINLLKFGLAVKNGNIWNTLRHLNAKEIKRLARSKEIPNNLANQWLAYHYGWKPLAKDVFGLYELLLESMKAPALLVHGRGQGRIDWDNRWISPTDGAFPSLFFEENCKIAARCNLTGRIENQSYLRTLNRVGLLNPAGLAWELIPFSFLVDWILPIGDVANGLSATAGLSFVGGHETLRHHRIIGCRVDPKYDTRGVAPSALYKETGFKRTVLGEFPRPTLYLKSPFLGGHRIPTLLSLYYNMVK